MTLQVVRRTRSYLAMSATLTNSRPSEPDLQNLQL